MMAAGPYDPSAYKPSTATASTDPIGNTLDADRYATGSSPPRAPVAQQSPSASQSLASDPADRYGAPRTSTTPTAMPGQTPLTDPAAVAADRYANPSLPALASKPAQSNEGNTVATGIAPSQAVKIAALPGQYRPGGTSTYNAVSATTSPMEIASRPPAPATTDSTPPTGSQPWAPSSTTKPPASRPY
jgi:hypothetical protein